MLDIIYFQTITNELANRKKDAKIIVGDIYLSLLYL